MRRFLRRGLGTGLVCSAALLGLSSSAFGAVAGGGLSPTSPPDNYPSPVSAKILDKGPTTGGSQARYEVCFDTTLNSIPNPNGFTLIGFDVNQTDSTGTAIIEPGTGNKCVQVTSTAGYIGAFTKVDVAPDSVMDSFLRNNKESAVQLDQSDVSKFVQPGGNAGPKITGYS